MYRYCRPFFAGIKKVTLSYEYNKNTVYSADYYVTVYYIRHFSIEEKPAGVKLEEDGSVTLTSAPVIWGELNEAPKTDDFVTPNAEWSNVIELDESMYTVNSVKSESNAHLYSVSIGINELTESLGDFLLLNGQSYNAVSVMQMDNKSNTADKLDLVVTSREGDANTSTGQAVKGKYILTDAAGEETVYDFSYVLHDGWVSSFQSSAANAAVADGQYGSGMLTTIGGVKFFATQPAWHQGVLGWDTKDVGTTYEQQWIKDNGIGCSATDFKIEEKDGATYAVVGGVYTAEQADFKLIATSIFFNFESNPQAYDPTYTGWDGFTQYTFNATLELGDNKTFRLYYDITSAPSYCYTVHFGEKVQTNLTLGAEKNGIVYETSAGDKYTLTSVPGSTQGAEYWGAIGVKVEKAGSVTFTAGGKTYTVDRDRILTLSNQSGTADKLRLLVTSSEIVVGPNGSEGKKYTRGFYEYTAANGAVSYHQFEYSMEGWTSSFSSASVNGGVIEDKQAGDDFTATVNGVTFRAEKLAWHKAILNMDS